MSINGQVTIPKAVRARLRIAYRDTVRFVFARDGSLRLEVERATPAAVPLPPRPFSSLRGRPRLHLRADEFMRLVRAHVAAKAPTAAAPFL